MRHGKWVRISIQRNRKMRIEIDAFVFRGRAASAPLGEVANPLAANSGDARHIT